MKPLSPSPRHGILRCERCAKAFLEALVHNLGVVLLALVAGYWLVMVLVAWGNGAIGRLVAR